MVSVGIQLYSVNEIPDSVATVLEHVAETELDGVEFYQLDDTAAVSNALQETGLEVAGAHVSLEPLEDDFEETVARWSEVGVETFVVPWADAEHFETREAIEELADRLSTIAAKLDERGYDLHYHNHDQEFVTVDGTYALEVLAENVTDVGLEVDLGWAGAAGADPLGLVERHADSIDLLHVKDYDAATGEPAKVGEGSLDLQAVADTAADHGIEWLIYEYEGAVDSYDTVTHAGDVMSPLKR